jgi:YihY family inner membrane protein
MDALAPIRAFDRFQRRHAPLAIPIAVLRKFSDDQAGNAAALIAFYAFLSLFPLLLLFITILGFVLQSHPGAERAVLHSALKQFPIVGDQLSHGQTLRGSGIGLVVGAIGSVLAGLGVTMAAQNAFNLVYAVPIKERPNFLVSRVRGLKTLLVLGLLQVLSTAASGAVTGGLGGLVGGSAAVLITVAGVLLSLGLNLLLFSAVFRMLTDDTISTHELVPGIVLAAVLWEILQAVGGIYIGHVIKGDHQTYGTFATVIGLIVWLYLGARVVVYSAEINTVLTRGLWPRSLLAPPTPADRRARAALAKTQEHDHRQTVHVTFHPDDHAPAPDPSDPPYTVDPHPEPGERARSASPAGADEPPQPS